MGPVQVFVALEITRKHHIERNTAQEQPSGCGHNEGDPCVERSAVITAVKEKMDRNHKQGGSGTDKVKTGKPC